MRDYVSSDEDAWSRCRVLAFLSTSYFDAVERRRAPHPPPGFGLVASRSGSLVGLVDVTVEGEVATIDTLAVHPDCQREGIGTRLLALVRDRAGDAGALVLEAWTRDDEQALSWYRSRGFRESDHYLHVYANHYTDPDEPARVVTARPGFSPIIVFSHAPLAHEDAARRDFARVHVCRRFSLQL